MELLQISYFIKAAKLENFSQAAKELHISQPALSVSLKRLEEEIGISLFDRHGKKIILNSYGQVFLKQMEPLLEQLKNVPLELQDMKNAENNRLMIISPPFHAFPGLLSKIKGHFPDTVISISNCPVAEMISLLKKQTFDFCITTAKLIDDDISSEVLREEKITALVPIRHRLEKFEEIKLASLTGEPFATYLQGTAIRLHTETLCHNSGFKQNIYFEGDTLHSIVETVREGKCVALLPTLGLSNYKTDELACLRITDPDSSAFLRIYWKITEKEKPMVKKIREIIISYFEQCSPSTSAFLS